MPFGPGTRLGPYEVLLGFLYHLMETRAC